MKRLSKIMCALIATSGLAAAPSVLANTTYVGAKIGSGWLDNACVSGAQCDDSVVGWGIYSGYKFSEQWGVELDSNMIGDFKTSFQGPGSTAVEFSDPMIAIALSPTYRFPIQQSFDIFAKAGPAYISHGGETDFVLSAGIGIEKEFVNDLALRLEYQYFDGFDDKYIQDVNANLLTVGLSYNFGTGNTTAAGLPVVAAAAVTQAPSEPITEVKEVVMEEKTTVVVTKEQTESFSQEMFATNSTELSADGKAALGPLIAVLQAHPESSVEVVGHTDSTGAAEYNMMVSKKRAASVAAYIEEQGIDASRITATGEGEENPVASNDTAEGRAMNRRVEATIPGFEYTEEVQVEKVMVEESAQ
ncbi:OmpA family protein [Vibrio sp. THAF190c]|uniref:OmpA family protein n=1 Tax=Vibrio sp. THAF190c TaxID=2587865 RepID=UPI001267FF50|nr:OmpA family protein [Vibrio sp. THAF190c]QFT12321.1 Outer membrane protein A precursor [Vibrio sp. THAF190c]